MKLIIGLGNHGNQYANNRHNVGFMSVNHFAKTNNWKFDKKEGLARTAHGRHNSEEVVLAKSQTFMNLSGEAVIKLVIKYRIKPNDLIVVHDEMDLFLGNIRIRQGGSSAGHNGIESIIQKLGTNSFIRLRIGVGHPQTPFPGKHEGIVGHVLGDFDQSEQNTLNKVLTDSNMALSTLISETTERAMNRFNKSNSLQNTPEPRSEESSD